MGGISVDERVEAELDAGVASAARSITDALRQGDTSLSELVALAESTGVAPSAVREALAHLLYSGVVGLTADRILQLRG